MAPVFHRTPIMAGLAAAALAAAPASAVELPRMAAPASVTPISIAPFAASAFQRGADVNQWGCWGCGWGGGWGGGWRGRGWRRRGPSAGEVLAGVAIIGGIAAIVSAANNNRRNRDVVVVDRDRPRDWERDWDDDRRNPPFREVDRRANPRSSGAGGLDGAVSQCLDVIERDVRVGEVQVVQRSAQGWRVGGTLFNGSGFECRIGNDGRIEGIDYGAGGPVGAASGGQWDDSRYAAARLAAAPSRPSPEGGIEMFTPPPSSAADPAAAGTAGGAGATGQTAQAPLVPLTAQRRPAYPGGPVEGEQPAPLVQRPGIP